MRAIIRKLYYRLPNNRRTRIRKYKGGWKLVVRKLIAPFFQIPVIIEDGGVRFCITSDPVDEIVAYDMLARKRSLYFPELPISLPAEPIILDIGAHHGFYTIFALQHYANSRVICVEPSSEGLKMLDRNVKLNGWEGCVRVVNGALAEAEGTGLLKMCVRGSYGHSLYEEDDQTMGVEEVQLVTLATILGSDRPDIIKCNAEGGEFTLIDQLRNSDLRPLLMIVMMHEVFGDMHQLVANVGAMGYRAFKTGTEKRPAFHFWRSDLPLSTEELKGTLKMKGAP